MIRFNNDYNHGALDSILSALIATNTDSFAGYGEDIWCQRARRSSSSWFPARMP